MNEFARTLAMFEQTPAAKPLHVMSGGWDRELFGCALREYVAVAFLLVVAAKRSDGRFSLSWLDLPEFHDGTSPLHFDVIAAAFESNFVTDVAGSGRYSKRRHSSPHRCAGSGSTRCCSGR